MGRRKCTPKQLAALKRGREKAHRRSKKTTNGRFVNFMRGVERTLVGKGAAERYGIFYQGQRNRTNH